MAEALGPRNMAEIRDDILTDIVLESAKAGVTENVGPGADNFIWATGMAGALMFAHARIDGAKSACTPFGATGPDLVDWKRSYRLPDVDPSPAAGRVRLSITGTATVVDGQPITIGGVQFSVVGNWPSLTDGSEVDVLADTPGSAGNARAGSAAVVLNPPTNVNRAAVVSSLQPITGGFDEETEERLKQRVLNRSGTSAGGGNWGHLREIAFNTSPAVQRCYVYPALGGPCTQKVVVLKGFDREINVYSREFPDVTLDIIRTAIHRAVSTATTTTVQTATDENVDVSLQVTLPDSTLSGGNGSGWLDIAPWPQLTGAETRCTVTSVSAAGILTVDADTATAPIAGQTRLAWWSPNDLRFHVRTITAQSGGTTAWVLTLDAPFVDTTGQTPAAGHYVCPPAENLTAYGETWVALLEQLGAGENTADVNLLENGRALRHPFQSTTERATLTIAQLNAISEAHPEIEDIAWSYRSATVPTVPGTVEDPPNVFVPRHFGIYPTV